MTQASKKYFNKDKPYNFEFVKNMHETKLNQQNKIIQKFNQISMVKLH